MSAAAGKRVVRKPLRRALPSTLDGFFAADGPLAAELPGYELRQQQLDVSRAVEQAIKAGVACMAEAGTGVGKTLAYLIPVVRAALKGKRTVISTHTINLQSQLVTRDIPFVLRLFREAGSSLSFSLMKGRANYLCKVALDYARSDMFLAGDPLFRKVQKWAARPGCSGDVGDLDFAFSAWADLTSTPDTCSGQDCSLYSNCHFYDMRRRAAESKIIVVNHALFFSDLAVRLDEPEAGFLPQYDHVVFDEAHHLEDVATKTFGVEFNSRRLINLVERIKHLKGVDIDGDRLNTLEEQNRALFAPFQRASRSEFTFEEILHDTERSTCSEAAMLTRNTITEIAKNLREAAKEDEKHRERLQGLTRMCVRAEDELGRLFFDELENSIRWGELNIGRQPAAADSRVALHLTPIDVSKVLGMALWDMMAAQKGSVVMLSATLANSGGFSYLRSRLGVPDNALECVVDSPFDFKRQALLYVPGHLPPPAPGGEYADLIAAEIRKVITLTSGRAFLLFTSRVMMNLVYERLEGSFEFPLFKQGDMPPGRLLEEFRISGGCLFGLQTFWEGVDIQGDSLSCVVIDKLPFAVPDSPITKARTQAIENAGGDWFREFSIPQAQIRLKQGFGRLIRTRTDTGIVCILDSRILTRNYGPEFVKYLPAASRASKWNRVERFYETVHSGASGAPRDDQKVEINAVKS